MWITRGKHAKNVDNLISFNSLWITQQVIHIVSLVIHNPTDPDKANNQNACDDFPTLSTALIMTIPFVLY